MKTQDGPCGRRSTSFSVSTVSTIPLSNNGQLAVYAVDSGSMLSTQYGNTSFLIVKGQDHLLIDCGFTVPQALTRLGINLSQIRSVILTHEHGDHVGGFQAVATANRFISVRNGGSKLTLLSHPRFADSLWDNSLGGLRIDDRNPTPSMWYDVVSPDSIDEDNGIYTFTHGSLALKLIRTAHTPKDAVSWKDSSWSTAVVVDDKVLITGDTRFSRDLIDSVFAEDLTGVQAIIHDVSSRPNEVHASLDELCALPLHTKTNMFLTHCDDGFTNEDVRRRVAKNAFRGIAYAGMALQFVS